MSVTLRTEGGVEVVRTSRRLDPETAIDPIVDALDSRRGMVYGSSFEYPGRYTRWDVGFTDPPIALGSRDRSFTVRALNRRGAALLPLLAATIEALPAVERCTVTAQAVTGEIRSQERWLPEEQRSRQHSIFSLVRGLLALLRTAEDGHLGLYGAFGYDLVSQFESIERRLSRPAGQRDLVLYLPDRLTVVDGQRHTAVEYRYDFAWPGGSTKGLPRGGDAVPYVPATGPVERRDHQPGQFAEMVRTAQEWFRRGDLFEVVPGQTFAEPCPSPPSEVFRRLRRRNPAPYGALISLGEGEYLVAASPEMYVRVSGRRVESCPISGTAARGEDAVTDAAQVRELLTSEKDEAELTMCTDVDRNDKSRVCEAGSVRVIGRRQIEIYSRVIHTVDHIEGRLREGFDALDAFLTHMWAVTVTGAPKLWAMRFIEAHERSPRAWYGGAFGRLGVDGNADTGLTLRTVRIVAGRAEVRAGATLLIDSQPAEEERETELKASAFLEAIRGAAGEVGPDVEAEAVGADRRVLLVDYEDSFVNTLANYVRQTGAEVLTVRSAGVDALRRHIQAYQPDLVLLSPGPGTPSDFDVPGAVEVALEAGAAVFGVCLGLQGIVEHFDGRLDVLSYPMHGKSSEIRVQGGRLLAGLPERFRAGRYHSIYAVRSDLPPMLRVTAVSDDGVVMAVEHRWLPVAGVQFHPESIMTIGQSVGLRLIRNVIQRLGVADESIGVLAE